MHRQKSLNGPGTVLNGFPSKQAYTRDTSNRIIHFSLQISKIKKYTPFIPMPPLKQNMLMGNEK